jgi:hypothetical protein
MFIFDLQCKILFVPEKKCKILFDFLGVGGAYSFNFKSLIFCDDIRRKPHHFFFSIVKLLDFWPFQIFCGVVEIRLCRILDKYSATLNSSSLARHGDKLDI